MLVVDGIAGLKVLLLLYTYHPYAYPPIPPGILPYIQGTHPIGGSTLGGRCRGIEGIGSSG